MKTISWNITDSVDKAIYDTQDINNMKPYDLNRKLLCYQFALQFPMSSDNQELYIQYQYEYGGELVTFTVRQLLEEIKSFYDQALTNDEITMYNRKSIIEEEVKRRVVLNNNLMFGGLLVLGNNMYKIILN